MNTSLQHMGKLLVMWLLCSAIIVKSAPNTTLVYLLYSYQMYGPEDLYQHDISAVKDDLVDDTPTNLYNYYSKRNGCYGHAACYGGLTQSDCGACLQEAENRLDRGCGNSIGCQVQLQDCRMRYEDHSFQEP